MYIFTVLVPVLAQPHTPAYRNKGTAFPGEMVWHEFQPMYTENRNMAFEIPKDLVHVWNVDYFVFVTIRYILYYTVYLRVVREFGVEGHQTGTKHYTVSGACGNRSFSSSFYVFVRAEVCIVFELYLCVCVQVPGVNIPISDIGYYVLTLLICSVFHELGHATAAVRYTITGHILCWPYDNE